MLTGDVYQGKHGKSLRVQGLEEGINDNVYSRSIVLHGSNYVNADYASKGKLGRSLGCLAVSYDVIDYLINMIKDKVLVVLYYPDEHWLQNSAFLT